jgi:hypothetical protein
MTGTDTARLSRFINLPYQPVSVRWQTTQRPGGNDWSLTALLELKPEDVRGLMKSATKLGPGRIDRAELKAWFPSSLKERYGGEPGDSIPVEAAHIDAAPFFAVDRSPLVHGDALVFEEEALVYLCLYTM